MKNLSAKNKEEETLLANFRKEKESKVSENKERFLRDILSAKQVIATRKRKEDFNFINMESLLEELQILNKKNPICTFEIIKRENKREQTVRCWDDTKNKTIKYTTISSSIKVSFTNIEGGTQIKEKWQGEESYDIGYSICTRALKSAKTIYKKLDEYQSNQVWKEECEGRAGRAINNALKDLKGKYPEAKITTEQMSRRWGDRNYTYFQGIVVETKTGITIKLKCDDRIVDDVETYILRHISTRYGELTAEQIINTVY